MEKKPLALAIAEAAAAGIDWHQTVMDRNVAGVRTEEDCGAVLSLLRAFPDIPPRTTESGQPSLKDLVSLVRSPDEAGARARLWRQALPELLRIYDCSFAVEHARPMLAQVLPLLAGYGDAAATARLIHAARQGIGTRLDWWLVFTRFGADHEAGRTRNNYGATFRRLLHGLTEPLPADLVVELPLLAWVNTIVREDRACSHPYDSDSGVQRLRQLLTESRTDDAAILATAALPLLTHPQRDNLLRFAQAHGDAWVRLEFGWAAGRLGWEFAEPVLRGLAGDPRYHDRAYRYLHEVGGPDWEARLPPICDTAEFGAMAHLASHMTIDWKHDGAPDYLELLDMRKARWDKEQSPTALIRYHVMGMRGDNASGVALLCMDRTSTYWHAAIYFEEPVAMALEPAALYSVIRCDYEGLAPQGASLADRIRAGQAALQKTDPAFFQPSPFLTLPPFGQPPVSLPAARGDGRMVL